MTTPQPSIWSIKAKKRRPEEESDALSSGKRRYIVKKEEDAEDQKPQLPPPAKLGVDYWGPGRRPAKKKSEDEYVRSLQESPSPKHKRKHTNRRINSRAQVTKTPLETRPATLNTLATKKLSRNDLINLQTAVERIDRFLSDSSSSLNPDEKYVDAFRKTIAKLPFQNVNREFIRLSKIIIHLNSLLDAPKAGINVPEDILLDAEALSTRWRNEDFDPHILRGITAVMRVRAAEGRGRQAKGRSYSLEPDYPFKKNPYVVGHNGLVVGQWWPLQICLLRDGAHGEIEAGISGNKEFGAFSVIISGSSYKDEDHGNTVFYCGTRGTPRALEENEDEMKVKLEDPETQERPLGTPSAGTQLLLTACKRKTPVRLHRSSKALVKSSFAPEKGIRYDGLYDVTGYAVLDQDYAMFRFTLERRKDQPEMRWRGPGVRPNAEELGPNGWSEVQRLLKGSL
ncbi:hypothetical protein RUND412_006339 [Rhizina undulata]